MNLQETTFEGAVVAFRTFLSDNGLDEPILWVFQEDTLSREQKTLTYDFWLKLPLPEENESFARMHFELGKRRGFGLGLAAFAQCDEGVCCGFVVPTDEEDAQYMFMGPEHLKFSFITSDMPVAKVVRNDMRWRMLKSFAMHSKPGCFFVYLASKADLQLQRLLALIETYKASVAEAASLFERYRGISVSQLGRARFEGLGNSGFIDPERTIQYHYHGIGLCVEYPDREIDWDFGHNGRMDGFDAWRLLRFAMNGTNDFAEFEQEENLNRVFAEAEQKDLIQRPFQKFQDRLYYLSPRAKQS